MKQQTLNCSGCNKPLTLTQGQINKLSWGQRKFYHDGCFKAGHAIKIAPRVGWGY